MTKMMLTYAMVMALGLLVFPHGAARAETQCGPDYEHFHVKLNSPFGCVTENLFKRQMDTPSDLYVPRAETPPDTDRRIKALSDWRQKKPAESAAPEKSQ